MTYYDKYLKYKNKYLVIKKQLGSASFSNIPSLEEDTPQMSLCECDNIDSSAAIIYNWFNERRLSKIDQPLDNIVRNYNKPFAEGGQSELFEDIHTITTLLRSFNHINVISNPDMIDIDSEEKYVLFKEKNFYNSEVTYSNILSNDIIHNVNPHFVLSYNYIYYNDKIYHLMERFDGDLKNLKTLYPDYNRFLIYEQLLFAILTLCYHKIIITDLTENNIYYKIFDRPFNLHYTIYDNDYYITTSVLFVIGDYGKARPCFASEPNKIRNGILLNQIHSLTDRNMEANLNVLGLVNCGFENILKEVISSPTTNIKCIHKIIKKLVSNTNTIQTTRPSGILLGPFNIISPII
jgi:hypothetical protein